MITKELTVKDLKKILADVPDDMLVVLSTDIEGNQFSPLCTYSIGVYVFGQKSWQRGDFYDEGEAIPGHLQGKKALALWPIH